MGAGKLKIVSENKIQEPKILSPISVYANQNINNNISESKSEIITPKNNFMIKAGSFIPATLLTGIHSDLPGQIIAKVRQNIFDTVSGNYLLIPQGSTLLGTYDSQMITGQSRILIAWQKLIFPNGKI